MFPNQPADTTPIVATPQAPAQAAPVAPAPAPAAQPQSDAVAAPTPAAEPAVKGTGTAADPLLLPAGSTEKVAELFKSKDAAGIEAFIASQPEESRAKLKELFEGKDVTVADAEAAPAADAPSEAVDEFSPFTEEELAAMDPVVAKRIAMAQEELLRSLEAMEQPRLPENIKRLLDDPVIRRRNAELESGKVVPLGFNAEAFSQAVLSAVESGDVASIQEILNVLPDAIKEIAQHHADLREVELQSEIKEHEAFMDRKLYFKSGMDAAIASIPELKPANVSPFLLDSLGNPALLPNGAPQLNPEHPGNQFFSWLQGMRLSVDAIEAMGGIKEMALQWVMRNKGGLGKFVAERNEATKQSMLDKLRSSRTAAQRQITAAPITGAQTQTSANSVHGVDIARAYADKSYARRATAGLSSQQIDEVAAASVKYMKER